MGEQDLELVQGLEPVAPAGRFQSANGAPQRADFTWHPLVHTREYDETLYFLLIRLEEARHRPVADQIREVLADAEVEYACEYSIFGYWDALVRVWVNDGAYHRLVRKFRDKARSNVQKFEAFVTTEIRYLWNGVDQNLLDEDRKVLQALARRQKLVESVVTEPEEVRDDTWATLLDEGLIIDRSKTEVDCSGVKFYIALERVGGDLTPEGEPERVLSAIKNCNLTKRSTLYYGTGPYAAYLVRGVADTYGEVLDYSAALDTQLAGTRLRPMTLLVANMDARESDRVNHPKYLSHRAETLLTLLDLDEESLRFANHDASDWEGLDELLRLAHELAGDDSALLDTLIDILKACMKDDHDELARASSFLTASEWFIGKYLVSAWRDSLGKQWFTTLKQRFEADKKLKRHAEELRKGEESWTAGSYAHFALATADFSDEFDARLQRQLMPDWKTQITRYYERRNEPGHGKLRAIPHLDAFRNESHRELLRELMEASTFCWRARRAVEQQAG